MANTSINVSKEKVRSFLERGQEKPFIIPEYQREYSWEKEHIEVLFDDLWGFSCDTNKKDDVYFLGNVVMYEKENELHIIDGQQRITTLFLFLRALYKMLEGSDGDEKVRKLMDKIKPLIWKTDKYGEPTDYSVSLILSNAVSDKYNQIFSKILETGRADQKSKDNYSQNYIWLQKLIEEKSKDSPFHIHDFIDNVYSRVILLPIIADSQDTALTIFSTLNNRGLQLSDANIFKASIYSKLDETKREKFIGVWKELEEKTIKKNLNINRLFTYFMFYLRAKNNDTDTTTPSLRNYYLKINTSSLYSDDLMENLNTICDLLALIYEREELDDNWSKNKNILKLLDTLSSYPNEYSKYPIIIYYLLYKNDENFERNFEKFLKNLIAYLIHRFLEESGINGVKSRIMKLNAEIFNNQNAKIDFDFMDFDTFETIIKEPHSRILKMILKLLSYQRQDELLSEKCEIEHILPKQSNYAYFDEIKENIYKYIENLGNKILLEKKYNIIAKNGYFNDKKKHYSKSKIAIAKELGDSTIKDWNCESIIKRNIELAKELVDIINDYKI